MSGVGATQRALVRDVVARILDITIAFVHWMVAPRKARWIGDGFASSELITLLTRLCSRFCTAIARMSPSCCFTHWIHRVIRDTCRAATRQPAMSHRPACESLGRNPGMKELSIDEAVDCSGMKVLPACRPLIHAVDEVSETTWRQRPRFAHESGWRPCREFLDVPASATTEPPRCSTLSCWLTRSRR